ncbi:molybdenum ABC transporter ATP-binding protein [Colwellia sp. UCD-KL20]|uniref:molybdenum ABC transporter ATP-binding protein n=1 Tax=Colwellia sp. UCD-KL20 TaxID=1917165 RepID=UPI000970E0D7|nr:molybdenum ABC transporter ATP-binding protein [Colwellia sp. UCD-KL20]
MNNLLKELSFNFNSQFDSFALSVKQTLPTKGITGIFGHSGSGKSTLLRLISGLENSTTGQLSLNGNVLFDSNHKLNIKPEKRRIGLVFQDSRLFPHLNVQQNLAYAHKRCLHKQLNINDIIDLTQLTPLLHKKVTLLSGGEKQRVAIARAVLSEPELLLLDEPLSALDNQNKALMITLLLDVQRSLNIPMLYVSHSLAELQQIADNLLVMKQGNIQHFGPIHQIIHTLNNTKKTLQQTSLSLIVKEHLPEYGLTSLLLTTDIVIYLPLQSNTTSANALNNKTLTPKKIRCYIAASDISISRHEATDSSIVNHFQAEILDIQPQNNTVLITLICAEQIFYSSISLWSAERLSLSLHDLVYIQFKASAVHSLADIGEL